MQEVLGFVGLADTAIGHVGAVGRPAPPLAIARAMAAKPSLLLLDDPTTGGSLTATRWTTKS